MTIIGKIYKVINNVDDMVYIGSTIQNKLSNRMSNHRTNAKLNIKKSKFYEHMRLIGIDNFKIILISKEEFDSITDMEKKEFEIINSISNEKRLNTNFEFGKHCEEHTQKVIRKGKDNANFKRGCIFEINKNDINGYLINNISFRWIIDGKQKSKNFSIKKYGKEKAIEMAVKFQNELYPLNVI